VFAPTMEFAPDRLCLGRMQNPVRGFMHGAAALLSIIGAVVLIDRAADDVGLRIALTVFGLSLVALYTVSSLYHSVPWRSVWKHRMQRADHSMIYIVVAATYTPFALVVCNGWLCAATLAATWGIAVVGIAQKIFWPEVGSWFSVTMQTVQGWLALPFIGMLVRELPIGAFLLVVGGGLAYTVGMVCFVTRRPRLWPRVFSYHELFHVCVVTGSGLHYAAILTYVAGPPAL
jgi:hemolysin III